MTETATRGRKSMTLEDRIAVVQEGTVSDALQAFADWAEQVSGITMDGPTLVAREKLYAAYLETDEYQEAKAERKAAAEARKAASKDNKRAKFLKLAEDLGIDVEDLLDAE